MLLAALSKVKRLPIFALLFTYVFVVSGLLISLLCVLLLVIWPFSKNVYRRITTKLAYCVLAQMAWIAYDFAGMRTVLFGDESTYRNFGKELCLITLSHRGDLDWVGGYIVAVQFGFLQYIRTLPKRSLLYVPGFGLLLWALECVFLTRNFAKDEKTIIKYTEEYKNYPFPIHISIFCEGTRFSEAKHERGLRFAREKGLTELKYHLIPRTKGFAVLAHHLKAKADFPSLYDVVFAYPDYPQGTPPGFVHIMMGKPLVIYYYMRHIPMSEVPSSQEELTTFCHHLYEIKDEAYGHFLEHGEFPAPRHPVTTLSQKDLWSLRLNQLFWISLLSSPWFYLLFTLSWAQLGTISAVSLVVLTALMLALFVYARQKVESKPKKT